jgi:hypothetical protein
VKSTTLETLEEDLEHFDPQVIICSGHKNVKSDGSRVWIELFVGAAQPAKLSASSGRSYELTNPTLEELMEVIDEFA